LALESADALVTGEGRFDAQSLAGKVVGTVVERAKRHGVTPFIIAGLQIAVPQAMIGAIVGEFVGSNGDPPSIGYLVLRSARSADTALTFAAVGAAAVLAGALYGAVRAAEALALGPYHPSQRGPRR
jgi:hypothetical protein